MPAIILRPSGIDSSTGFDVSGTTLLDRISDNNIGTLITQNQSSASIVCKLSTLTSDLQNAVITNVIVSVVGLAGRSGSNTLNVQLLTDMSTSPTNVQETTLNFTGVGTTQVTSEYSVNLNFNVVNDMGLSLTPGTNGMDIVEVFITVSYLDPTQGKIRLSSGKVLLEKGKIIL